MGGLTLHLLLGVHTWSSCSNKYAYVRRPDFVLGTRVPVTRDETLAISYGGCNGSNRRRGGFTVIRLKPEFDVLNAAPELDVDGKADLSGFGRRVAIDEVLEGLGDDNGNGVILLGEYGVGKTFVARQVIGSLGTNTLVYSLRCSSSTAKIRYGPLEPLLEDLSGISLENPMVVLRCATTALKARAKGRKIVLFIDNVDCLDDSTALIVMQLAVNGIVTVLLACESLRLAPADIVGLWRDGLIRRVDLLPFTESDTRNWLESILDAKISNAAARGLWNMGSGNPRFLESIVQEQISARTLVKRDAVWVVTGAPFVCGRNSVDTVMAAFGGTTPEEWLVAEVLSLSAGLPLNQLMRICDVSAVDSLQERGFLVVSHEESSTAAMANRLVERVVREKVPAGRSRELHRLVLGASNDPSASRGDDFPIAMWGLDCGIPVELGRGISVARAATNAGRPEDALRIIDSLPRHLILSGLVSEKARALVASGESVKAKNMVFGAGLELEQLSLRQWTDVMLLRSALWQETDHGEAGSKEILERIKTRLDREDNASEDTGTSDRQSGLADLREELSLNMVELELLDGRHRESMDALRTLFRHGRAGETRLKAGKWLIEASLLTGRTAEALKMAEETELQTLFGRLEATTQVPATCPLIAAVIMSLMPEISERNGTRPCNGAFMAARNSAFSELAEGLSDAYNGRVDAAVEHLLPVASQLKQLGESETSKLACAAVAYVYALAGQKDLALQYVTKSRTGVSIRSRLLNTVCAYFQVHTMAELGSKEKATVRLFALADDERRYQTTAVEMTFILSAIRLGSTAGAQRLVTLANRVQGPMARICEGLGQGMIDRNAATLVRVAEAAADMGDDLLSRDVARLALKIANENLDRDSMRLAQQLIRGRVAKLGQVIASSEDGQTLTHRELEIASQAAAGESNKNIANKMHISVRTVEGHLYQVYSKLQVTSRAQLRETLV